MNFVCYRYMFLPSWDHHQAAHAAPSNDAYETHTEGRHTHTCDNNILRLRPKMIYCM